MTAASTPPGPSGFLGRVLLLCVALGPPAVVAQVWPEVRSSPGLAFGALLGWWALVAVGRFAGQVAGVLGGMWAQRVADVLDRAVMRRTSYRGRYGKSLVAGVSYVDLEGVPTQSEYHLDLHEVYVDVGVAPRPLHDAVREPYLGTMAAVGERVGLRKFLDVPEPVRLAVVAGPGAGKSTLLRRTALNWERRRGGLPILLILRDHVAAILDDPGLTLADVVASLRWLHGDVPAAWFERRLERGRCLVLLDGLDEVAGEDHRRAIVDWVSAQIIRYPRNDFVITSRPYGYETAPLAGASVLQVWRFTPEQATRFVHGWYLAMERRSRNADGPDVAAHAREAADDLLVRVRAQPALFDLAANPLLLTMICNVHRYRGALPGGRAELYGEMCEVLLYRRQEAKRLADPPSGLTGGQKKLVLRELALHMMRHKVRDLPTRDLHKVITPALARVVRRADAAEFLTMVERSGLLVQREAGSYAFAHLTLQEYLAAEEIREKNRPDILTETVDDPWWRETALLWAAGSDAGPLVEACLRSGSARALALAFDCQDDALELAPGLRDRLDDLLSSSVDDERRALMVQVKVTRSLRRTITLGNGAEACAIPVSAGLYRLFVEDSAWRGEERRPDLPGGVWPDDDDPISGLWDVDLEPFLAWVGEHQRDQPYRLPTAQELNDPVLHPVADIRKRPVWARNEMAGRRPKPATAAGVAHPFGISVPTLQRRLQADRVPAAMFAMASQNTPFVPELARRLFRQFSVGPTPGWIEAYDWLPVRVALDYCPDLRPHLADARLTLFAGALPDFLPASVAARDDGLRRFVGLLDSDFVRSGERFAKEHSRLRWRLDLLSSPALRSRAYEILALSYPVVLFRWLQADRPLDRRRDAEVRLNAYWARHLRGMGPTFYVSPGRAAGMAERALVPPAMPGDEPMRVLTAVIADNLVHLLDKVLTRAVPVTAEIATCLRFGAMALAAAYADHEDARVVFINLACGVTALEERARGEITPDDLVVLVRN
ncbi:hypothetical protein DP939_21720 [Spongiactinospora rosea]|uniref:NACHT domain-containing protein n=1 Tax=Spongiactinospora rosea TaxID=2248750 RepID=A0A366LXF7_9ACTN|nr:NACHT domain-containing protein [Spongiactinospora rosea]RBQ17994.1 hypothetical protein DP939_21720 [Spongiactinospora rosea]